MMQICVCMCRIITTAILKLYKMVHPHLSNKQPPATQQFLPRADRTKATSLTTTRSFTLPTKISQKLVSSMDTASTGAPDGSPHMADEGDRQILINTSLIPSGEHPVSNSMRRRYIYLT